MKASYNTIGGTTISAIVGCNPHLSPRGAFYKLRNEAPPTPTNDAMERGIAFEPAVAGLFAANHSEFVVVHNTKFLNPNDEDFRKPEYCHGDEDYITGSPDRLLYDASKPLDENSEPVAGLEIKTATIANRSQWGAFGTDQIPQHYLIQCMWYMQFYNVTTWYLAVQFFSYEEAPISYGEYVIKRDDEIIETLKTRAREFWGNHVLTGVLPEDNTIDSTVVEYVKQQYPASSNPMRETTEEENEAVKKYLEMKLAKDKAEAEYEAAKINLQMIVGDASGLVTPYGNVTWKSSKGRETVDWKSVASELGATSEVIKAHTKTSAGSRVWNDRGLKYGN